MKGSMSKIECKSEGIPTLGRYSSYENLKRHLVEIIDISLREAIDILKIEVTVNPRELTYELRSWGTMGTDNGESEKLKK